MTDLENAARQALNRLKTAQEGLDAHGQCRDITEIQIAGDLWPETVALRAALAQQVGPVVDAVQAELDAIARAFGGDAYWMDPPDGGSVTLAEQVARANKAGRERDHYRPPKQAEPVAVGWLCSPNGDFKRNLLYRTEFPPQSIAWQVPVYFHPQAEPVAKPSNESMLQAGRFCDANCTAMDHHSDCVIGNPSY